MGADDSTATLLKDLGVPPRDTMEIHGRARIAVTMEIYTAADDAWRSVSVSSVRCSGPSGLTLCRHFCCHQH